MNLANLLNFIHQTSYNSTTAIISILMFSPNFIVSNFLHFHQTFFPLFYGTEGAKKGKANQKQQLSTKKFDIT